MTDRIEAARAAVAEERSCVRAEHDAFEAFERRVADFSAVAASTSPPLLTDPQPTGRSLERVRSAYEETVMSVPHYQAEYGDTVAESLAVEFGEDLAAALVGGTALTPEFREAVRAAADAARQEREEFLGVLDREDASLARAATDLAEVRADLDALDDRPLSDRTFDDLRSLWEAVGDVEARIEGVAMRRQETIRGHRGDLPGVPTDLAEYLYADLPVRYPVLSSVADLGTAVDRAGRRIERRLASTP
ncbi:DUF7260 family protein [Haloplanus halophilus]|uniref:DUF7260 family protein n=1 Tax=Haloplanus halophilus TaxID=2949993 RepID=UPI00203EEEE4|nr:hypothetical protein [Haloplanus sp. GDY1]